MPGMGGKPLPRILVVEDNEDDRRFFTAALRHDFDISLASSGEEGLAILEVGRETPWSVIIADYHLPGISGIEFLTRVGSVAPDAGRMLVTADTDMKDAKHPVTPLLKPIPMDKLIYMVTQLAELSARAKQIRARATRPTDPALRGPDLKKR